MNILFIADPLDAWQEKGGKGLYERAVDKYQELRGTLAPLPIPLRDGQKSWVPTTFWRPTWGQGISYLQHSNNSLVQFYFLDFHFLSLFYFSSQNKENFIIPPSLSLYSSLSSSFSLLPLFLPLLLLPFFPSPLSSSSRLPPFSTGTIIF